MLKVSETLLKFKIIKHNHCVKLYAQLNFCSNRLDFTQPFKKQLFSHHADFRCPLVRT